MKTVKDLIFDHLSQKYNLGIEDIEDQIFLTNSHGIRKFFFEEKNSDLDKVRKLQHLIECYKIIIESEENLSCNKCQNTLLEELNEKTPKNIWELKKFFQQHEF